MTANEVATPTPATAAEPVRKAITVQTSPERAFRVFTAGIDTWWPASHHIGKSPLKRAVLEQRPGGRCYSEQDDGSECDWGTVIAWEPPLRLVLAWQVTPGWQYESDLAQASEVEVRFTAVADGATRVDLEHRHLERHGLHFGTMRAAIDSPGGWTGLLQLFAARAEQAD